MLLLAAPCSFMKAMQLPQNYTIEIDGNSNHPKIAIVQEIINGFKNNIQLYSIDVHEPLGKVQILTGGFKNFITIENATPFIFAAWLMVTDNATHQEIMCELISNCHEFPKTLVAKIGNNELRISPIYQLTSTRNIKIIDAIIQKLINIGKVNDEVFPGEGNTLLHILCSQDLGYLAFQAQADKLIDNGANLLAKDKNGHIPLAMIYLTNQKDLKALGEKYIEKKIDLTTMTNSDYGNRSLFLYLWGYTASLQSKLVDYAMTENKYNVPLDSLQNYLLHYLASNKDLLTSKWQDTLKSTLELKNNSNETALDAAIKESNLETTDFLISKGAKLTDVDTKATLLVREAINLSKSSLGGFDDDDATKNQEQLKNTLSIIGFLLKNGAKKAALITQIETNLQASPKIYTKNLTSLLTKIKAMQEASGAGSTSGGSGGGSGGESGSGSTNPLTDLKTALNTLKAKLVTLANALKK